jgi:OPT oligopeptide transporter protein
MILGDGLFQFLAVIGKTTYDMYNKQQASTIAPFSNVSRGNGGPDDPTDRLPSDHPYLTFDDRRRTNVFLKDEIPTSVVLGSYIFFALLSMILIPHIFPQLHKRDIFILYLVAPVLAFSNSYGSGLTDWSLGSSYGKLAVFIFGAVAGVKDGGVVAGLAACGVAMGIVSTASDLMQVWLFHLDLAACTVLLPLFIFFFFFFLIKVRSTCLFPFLFQKSSHKTHNRDARNKENRNQPEGPPVPNIVW